MAQLIVRNLEPDIVQALKERAGRHGRSAEAEHRDILRKALAPPPAKDLKTLLLEMPNVGKTRISSEFERFLDRSRGA